MSVLEIMFYVIEVKVCGCLVAVSRNLRDNQIIFYLNWL